MSSIERICENCIYYQPKPLYTDLGECRFFPPEPGREACQQRTPVKDDRMACHEFLPRKKTKFSTDKLINDLIDDKEMSVRLAHRLWRFFKASKLSELSKFRREEFLIKRGIGEKSMLKLDKIMEEYGFEYAPERG